MNLLNPLFSLFQYKFINYRRTKPIEGQRINVFFVVIFHRCFLFRFYYQRLFGNVHIDNMIDGTFYYHWFECRVDNKRFCSEIWPKFSISCCIVCVAVCNNQPSNVMSSRQWIFGYWTSYENNRQHDNLQNRRITWIYQSAEQWN